MLRVFTWKLERHRLNHVHTGREAAMNLRARARENSDTEGQQLRDGRTGCMTTAVVASLHPGPEEDGGGGLREPEHPWISDDAFIRFSPPGARPPRPGQRLPPGPQANLPESPPPAREVWGVPAQRAGPWVWVKTESPSMGLHVP